MNSREYIAWVEVIDSRDVFKMHLKARCRGGLETVRVPASVVCQAGGKVRGVSQRLGLSLGNNPLAVPGAEEKPSVSSVLLEEPDGQLGITWQEEKDAA